MSQSKLIRSLVAACLVLGAGSTFAADAAGEQVFGSQLMTQQERNEYRLRMQSAKTPEDQARIRAEHHESMQARAHERGVTLPATPPERGAGRGMGPGMGGGGPGMGMGPGMGGGGQGMGAGRGAGRQ